MFISVLLVTCNSAAVIGESLRLLKALPEIAEYIVVDNNSSDDTCAIIEADFPEVQLLRNAANMGFARAVNQGLAFAEHPYLLLLNPDAGITVHGLKHLLAVLEERQKAACVAPFFSGGGHDGAESLRMPEIAQPNMPLAQETDIEGVYSVQFVSGALALFRTEVLRAHEGFDEAFFLFFEDDDLSMRLHASGHELLLVLGAEAYHRVGQSTAPSDAVAHLKQCCWYWSRWYLHRKHQGRIASWLLLQKDKHELRSLQNTLAQMPPLDMAVIEQACGQAEHLHAQALLKVELALLDAQNSFEQALYARMIEVQPAAAKKKAKPIAERRSKQHEDYAEHMTAAFQKVMQAERETPQADAYVLPVAWQVLAEAQTALWERNTQEQAVIHAQLGEELRDVKAIWDELADLDNAFVDAEEKRKALWLSFYEEVNTFWMAFLRRKSLEKHVNALSEAVEKHKRNPLRYE